MRQLYFAAVALLGGGLSSSAVIAGPTGMELYIQKCGACHSVDADRTGPRHRNVVGRKVASVPGFAYSDAIKKLGGVWTPARLDQWLSGPQKMAPGSNMYLSVPDPAERALIIGYLSSVSSPKK